jgi:hypothetical protein
MSDIISAKCFGCGHIVKVPGALGGKKARCPKCTNTITIPAPMDTAEDVVSDEELPEVAKDDEVLDGLPVEEEPAAEDAAPSRETRPRPGSSSSHRRVAVGGRAVPGGRGTQPRYAAPAKKSSAGLVIGLILGAVVLIVVVVLAASGSGGRKAAPPKQDAENPQTAPPPAAREETEADRELKERVRRYVGTFNRGNIAEAATYYGPDAGKEVSQGIGRLVEAGTQYKDWNFKSVNADTGVVVITCEYVTKTGSDPNREVTFTWKNVEGAWYLTDKP